MGCVDPFLPVEVCCGRGSLPGALAGPIDDAQQLVDRVVEVVVDEDVVGELEATGSSDSALRSRSATLSSRSPRWRSRRSCSVARRRQDEDQDGVGALGLDLLGAVDLDLEDDVAPWDRLGIGVP